MADTTHGAPPNKVSQKPNQKKSPVATELGVRDPDALQESMIDIWGWVEENAALVGGLIALVILAVIARSTMTWFSGRKEVKAQDAYYEVEAKYAKLKEGFDRAKYKAAMPQMAPKDEKSDDKAATGDLAKDYGSIVGDLEKVARDFAGTSAGAQAAILASDTFMTYQQPDKAAEIAQVATKAMDDRSMLAGLARMQLGAALATKGDCKEAVKVWGEVIANKSAAFLQGDASLRSGICFEALNEPQKAMEMYQKVSAEGPESSSATTAKGLLRALELKTKATAAPAKQG